MYLTNADAFVDWVEHADSLQSIGVEFAAFLRSYDFLAVSAGHFRATPEGFSFDFFFNTWPAAWRETYEERNYVLIDPAPVYARLSAEPFSWGEMAEVWRTDNALGEFAAWIASIGVKDGFAVPVHYPGGEFGLCVAISARPIVQPIERRTLHLASLYVLKRCRALSEAATDAVLAKKLLSAREMDCMRWVMRGKSDGDISEILGIAHSTVHFHVERVKKKLGVRTRLQAARSLGFLINAKPAPPP